MLALDTSFATLEDVFITSTTLPGCIDSGGCPSFGHAMGSVLGSTVSVTGSVLKNSERCGLFISTGRACESSQAA